MPAVVPLDASAMAALAIATLAGQPAGEIARRLRMDQAVVEALQGDPLVQQACRDLEMLVGQRLQQGAFGALAIAKEEGLAAMRRIVGIARDGDDDRVRLQANKDLLAYQGIIPAKRVEIVGGSRIIDEMTPEELVAFARDGVLPERFARQKAQGRITYQPSRATPDADAEDDGVVEAEIDEADDGRAEGALDRS